MRRIATAGWFIVALVDWRKLPRHGRMGAAEVRRVIVIQRANDCDKVRQRSEVFEVFADLQPGRCGGNCGEFTTYFCGRVWFWVQSVELTGSAPHEQQQAAFCRSESRCLIGDAD